MKRHLDQNQIRSLLDGEMEGDAFRAAQAHLDACPICQQKAGLEKARMERVASLFSNLEPLRLPNTRLSPAAARLRLQDRISNRQMEVTPIMKRIFNRRSQPAWIALVVILVLGLSLAIPQVRAFATGLLSTFRVQQVTVLPVDVNQVSQNLDQYTPNLQALLKEGGDYEVHGEVQQAADAAEASRIAGYDVRLPSTGAEISRLEVQPAFTGTYTLDVNHINDLLRELDQTDLLLADTLNGATVTIEAPAITTATFGDCPVVTRTYTDPDMPAEVVDTSNPDCQSFIQLPSPVLTAPDGLDIAKYAKSFLVLAGMDEKEAEILSQRIDWTTTLVVPVPVSEATYQTVQVDGVDATLLEQTGDSANPHYALLWVKDGKVYLLSGMGDPAQAVEVANSLQ